MSQANDTSPYLLLVDDDVTLCQVLGRSLERRGYRVLIAHDPEQALGLAERYTPAYAVVDLRIGDASGLVLTERLTRRPRPARVVVLTGFASIATAVEAIKLGAVHYLTKPADTGEVVSALTRQRGQADVPLATRPASPRRLEWEHLQKVLLDCDGNVSEAARRLGMHRRTLQRKLQKRPVRE